MPKFFPLVRKQTVEVEVPVDSSEVTTNKIRIDWRDSLARLAVSVGISPRTIERVSFATTNAIVLLVKVTHTFSTTVTDFVRATATVYNTISTTVSQFIGLRTFESFTATLQHFTGLRTFESVSFTETPSVSATATTTNTVSFSVPLAIAPRATEQAVAKTDQSFAVDGTGYGESTVTTTGITNPSSVLGNTTSTAATAVASSSGLGGLTSNTTPYDLVFELEDADLGNLITDIESAVVHLERAGSVSGISVGGTGTIDTYYGFGGTPAAAIASESFNTLGAIAKGEVTLDITTAVADSFSNLNNLRLRATGSVTSGTGLGATATASFYRGWVTFTGTGAHAA